MIINLYFCGTNPQGSELYRETRNVQRNFSDRIKIWINRSAWNKGTARDVEIIDDKNQEKYGSSYYYEWKIDTCHIQRVDNVGIVKFLRRIDQYDNEKYAFVCDNEKRQKGLMIAFEDAIHRNDLPKDFIRVCWLQKIQDIVNFCEELNAFSFDINNATKFRRTGKMVKGKPVFEEITTGNHLYLDSLHKSHFEVFTASGRHLGEMDLSGHLHAEKADSSKRYQD